MILPLASWQGRVSTHQYSPHAAARPVARLSTRSHRDLRWQRLLLPSFPHPGHPKMESDITTQPTGLLLWRDFHPLGECCYGLQLPSTGITRLRRYCGPLRHPIGPGLLLTEVQLMVTRHHRWGFPCCVGSPLARMPPSIPRQGHAMMSLVVSRGGSLPRFHGGSAPALRVWRPARRSLRVTACVLAESLNDPFHRKLRPFRYLHSRFGCYRLV
jgi:hypothetical protein